MLSPSTVCSLQHRSIPSPPGSVIDMPPLAHVQDKHTTNDLKVKKTKSRNGCGRCKLKRVTLPARYLDCHTDTTPAQVRRDHAWLPTVQEKERCLSRLREDAQVVDQV